MNIPNTIFIQEDDGLAPRMYSTEFVPFVYKHKFINYDIYKNDLINAHKESSEQYLREFILSLADKLDEDALTAVKAHYMDYRQDLRNKIS